MKIQNSNNKFSNLNPFDLPQPPTSRFNYKNNFLKNPKKIIIEPIEELDSYLSILCINCQNLININLVESHSTSCVSLETLAQEAENGPEFEEMLFKQLKFKKCIEEVVNTENIKFGDKNYAKILMRLNSTILESSTLETIDQILNSLSSLLISFKGSLSIRVYLDRFHSLISQMKLILSSKIEEQETKSPLKFNADLEVPDPDKNSLKAEVEKLKKQTELYKTRAQHFQEVLLKSGVNVFQFDGPISLIGSELSSEHSVNSKSSSFAGVLCNNEVESPKNVENFEIEGIDDLKKYFYTICLTQKIKMTSMKMQTPNLSVSKLYQEVVEADLQPEKWSEFVISQFKKPENRFLEAVGRKNVYAKKKQTFETIVEEDSFIN